MKAKIIKIGKSRGIHLPAAVLRERKPGDDVVLEGADVVWSVSVARAGWERAFKKMAESSTDDQLLNAEFVASKWDREEWEWR